MLFFSRLSKILLIRERISLSSSLVVAPAFFGAFYLVCGILAVCSSAFMQAPRWLIGALALSAVFCLFCRVRASRGHVFFLGLGFALGWVHLFSPFSDYTDFLSRGEGAARIRGVCVDSAYSADELNWLLEPSGVVVRVTEFYSPEDGAWHESAGRALLRCDNYVQLGYGAEFEAEGAFLRLPKPVLSSEFDYGDYLRIRGVRRIFDSGRVEIRKIAGGFYWPGRLIFALRELCAENLANNLHDRDARSIALAMTLGYRQGLRSELARSFVRSGVVHVFAISGLHVGIAAAMIGALLQLLRLPYRFRYFVLPIFVGFYVLMTGAAPSALRAWLMISIWCVGKAWLKPVSPINTVCAAALVLLVWNPLMLFDRGFLFSFAVVGTLISGWVVLTPLENAMGERWLWIPPHIRENWQGRALRRIKLRILGLFAGSGLAWLGSAGLILAFQGLLIPGAVIVNAGVALFVWMIILLSGLKIISGAMSAILPVLDLALGWLLELFIRGMSGMSCLGQAFPMSMTVSSPHVLVVVTYYCIVIMALAFAISLRRRLLLFGAAVSILLGGVCIASFTRDDVVAIFYGGETSTPVFIADVGMTSPFFVNAGSYWTGCRAASWLAGRGYDGIECLILTGWGRDRAAGAQPLLREVKVRTLVLPDEWRRSQWLSEMVAESFRQGVRIREYDYPRREGNRAEMEMAPFNFAVTRIFGQLMFGLSNDLESTAPGMSLVCRLDRYYGSEIRLGIGGGKVVEFHLPFQLQPVYYEINGEDFPERLDFSATSGIFKTALQLFYQSGS